MPVEFLRLGFIEIFLLSRGFNTNVVLKCCSTVVLSCIFYDVISALTTSLLAKWRDIDQVCSIFLQFQPCYRFNAFGKYCQMPSFFSSGLDAFSLGAG